MAEAEEAEEDSIEAAGHILHHLPITGGDRERKKEEQKRRSARCLFLFYFVFKIL